MTETVSDLDAQIKALEESYQSTTIENQQLKNNLNRANLSMFGQDEKANLIEGLLNLREEMDRIEHLLRGNVISYTEKGDIMYVKPTKTVMARINLDKQGVCYYEDKDDNKLLAVSYKGKFLEDYSEVEIITKHGDKRLIYEIETRSLTLKEEELKLVGYKKLDVVDSNMKPFNDYGVNLLMNVLSFYINKNTILSNYDVTGINVKMKDFGDELADLISFKYEQMGMNTPEKRKLFPMIHRALIDSVHSTYLRALNGKQLDAFTKTFFVNQNQPMMQQGGYPMPVQQQRKGGGFSLNPLKWFRS